ncbi:response regulator [Fusibacter sp. 3D3]|uniref:response regulator n=1 Tax=Fusibacter sp. 3D3 TaxID=1048380 RepID=UPI00085344C6|nr:response regulator [Fusibacter sp. 3D3]GAU77487.1 chemotaxis regulator [Fusibacter sp. 3D3]
MARIMIVDDSTVMRMNLKKILTDVGHTIVAEAQNGKEACAQYEKYRPDLVTMDISMPVMTGVEATKAIVSKFPDAVIVMISALNQKKMVYDALKNGAKHYIIKPIDQEKVISVLNEVLRTDVST